MNNKSKNTYATIPTDYIDEEMLLRLFTIEQDMWARGIGEYIKCRDCKCVFSKEDIYGVNGFIEIPLALQRETVGEIEKILGDQPLHCRCCGGKTSHVFNREEYLPEMQKRYSRDESFLTVAKDSSGEIIGFMDAYVAPLQEIFYDELGFHFTPEIIEEICTRYSIKKNTQLLTFSSLGTDDKNKSLFTTLQLIKAFFSNLDDDYDDISAIFESIIGSTTYSIFSIMGAEKLGFNKTPRFLRQDGGNQSFQTDILFQKGLVKKYKTHFNVKTREVVTYSRSTELASMYA